MRLLSLSISEKIDSVVVLNIFLSRWCIGNCQSILRCTQYYALLFNWNWNNLLLKQDILDKMSSRENKDRYRENLKSKSYFDLLGHSTRCHTRNRFILVYKIVIWRFSKEIFAFKVSYYHYLYSTTLKIRFEIQMIILQAKEYQLRVWHRVECSKCSLIFKMNALYTWFLSLKLMYVLVKLLLCFAPVKSSI